MKRTSTAVLTGRRAVFPRLPHSAQLGRDLAVSQKRKSQRVLGLSPLCERFEALSLSFTECRHFVPSGGGGAKVPADADPARTTFHEAANIWKRSGV